MVADHRNQIVQHHDLAHAGNRYGSTIVDVGDRTAEHGARREGRELHSRRQGVDAVLALPLTLSGVSRRFSDRPIKRKALGSLSGGSFGGVTAAARPTSAP